MTCLLLLAGMGPAYAQVALPEDARQLQDQALRARLVKIAVEREDSGKVFERDKSECTPKTLINACVVAATDRRRAREAILSDAEVSARAQLRQIAVTEKNESLAKTEPNLKQRQEQEAKRRDALVGRTQKEADLRVKLADQQRKRDQEAENRKVYEAKLARAAERQAEVRAKLESSKQENQKIEAEKTSVSKPQAAVAPKATTSAN